MTGKLPPHNQRRLNAAIRDEFGDLYEDWYDMARSMQIDGATQQEIAERFSAMGVRVSQYMVCTWLQKRREAA